MTKAHRNWASIPEGDTRQGGIEMRSIETKVHEDRPRRGRCGSGRQPGLRAEPVRGDLRRPDHPRTSVRPHRRHLVVGLLAQQGGRGGLQAPQRERRHRRTARQAGHRGHRDQPTHRRPEVPRPGAASQGRLRARIGPLRDQPRDGSDRQGAEDRLHPQRHGGGDDRQEGQPLHLPRRQPTPIRRRRPGPSGRPTTWATSGRSSSPTTAGAGATSTSTSPSWRSWAPG